MSKIDKKWLVYDMLKITKPYQNYISYPKFDPVKGLIYDYLSDLHFRRELYKYSFNYKIYEDNLVFFINFKINTYDRDFDTIKIKVKYFNYYENTKGYKRK